MTNMLTDLQNHLFEQIEWLKDRDIKGDELDEEIKRSLAVNELAKTAVTNGALMAKCFDTLSGLDNIPAPEDLPLVRVAKNGKPAIARGKQELINFPKVAMG